MFHHNRFFREGRGESPFHKGDLKYVILDLIKDKPRYGYEVIRALEERSHGFYTPSPGTVYPTLQMLEEMGYVTANQQDGKKVYSITEEGRQYLAKHQDFAEEILSHLHSHWDPEHIALVGELMGEVHKFGHLFRHQFHQVDAEKKQRILEVISKAHKEIEGILAEKK